MNLYIVYVFNKHDQFCFQSCRVQLSTAMNAVKFWCQSGYHTTVKQVQSEFPTQLF